MQLYYFAWVRETVGKREEEIALDTSITTVADLIDFLERSGENYQRAFARRALIRVALDRNLVSHDTTLAGANEVAFFPPMTGG